MKNLYQKIRRGLYHGLFSEELTFDARLLNALCASGFVAVVLSIIGHLIENSSKEIWWIKLVMLVSLIFLFWIVNKYNLHKIGSLVIVVTFTDVLFPLVFIWNGGYESGMSAYFVVTLVVIVLLSKGIIRYVLLGVHLLVLAGCYFLNWYYPQYIIKLTETQQFIDGIVTFLVASILIGWVIVIMQHMYKLEQKRAELASEAKGSFLAQMSHEMRTPLNAIIGMNAIAKNSDDMAKIKDSMDKIESASEHLLGIINDILDMAKIESGKMVLDTSDFDFYKMIERIKILSEYHVEKQCQQFYMEIDERIPQYLNGDGQRLAQVITNLISNAVKFTPSEGRIDLRVKIIEDVDALHNRCKLEVTVTDTGIGISDEQKEKLFTPFEQADNTIARKYGGSGLGLAISMRIIELMDGEIYVNSVIGEGAEFVFTAMMSPATQSTLYDEEEDTAADLVVRAEQGEFENKIVLIVDDIDINREIVKAMLEDMGLQVESAKNGKAAVEMFAKNPNRYDLIFMDIQMPEMDGYEATHVIRAMQIPRAKSIPIIAMTANVFSDDIVRSSAMGMNGHIGKPLKYEKVLKYLRRYIN